MSEPEKLTPTQRLERRAEEQHQQLMAALTKPTFEASEKLSVGRDSRGYHYDVQGVTGDGESLAACGARVLELCEALDSRLAFEPQVEADVSRNAKGDHQFTASGDPERAVELAKYLEEQFPLSRTQNYGRDYTPNEKDAVVRPKR